MIAGMAITAADPSGLGVFSKNRSQVGALSPKP
jgi:hypothetical protein